MSCPQLLLQPSTLTFLASGWTKERPKQWKVELCFWVFTEEEGKQEEEAETCVAVAGGGAGSAHKR